MQSNSVRATYQLSLEAEGVQSAMRSQHTRFALALKRLVDIVLSAMAMFFLGPLFALVAVSIRRDSPGPVFYRGPRLGKGGRLFQMLKFRTMSETPASYAGPRLTAADDERITPLGRWLRDSKINELPQLWNVLAGDMSLVGPRPEDPELAKEWSPQVRQEILSVRPGITSPASVLYRNEEALLHGSDMLSTYLGEIAPSKLRLDQLYVRHHSPLLDLDTLFWTLLVVLLPASSSPMPEERLFLGPLSRLVRRYLSWFAVDLLITLAAIAVVGAFWRSFTPLDLGWPMSIAVAFGFALLFSLVGALMGVNRVAWSKATLGDVLDLLPPVLVSSVIALGLNAIPAGKTFLPTLLILLAAALAFAGFVLVRYRSRLFASLAQRWLNTRQRVRLAQERVLIVGGGDTGQLATWWLQNGQASNQFNVVGMVDDDLYKQDMRIRGVDVLGRCEDLPELVKRHDVGIIIFAIHNVSAQQRQRLLDLCTATAARVFQMPDILQNLEQVTGEGLRSPVPALNPQRAGASLEPAALAELDALAQRGDLPALRRRLAELRQFNSLQ